ncbi:DDB1- and CUL4-associated factor 8 isoform X2 [Toxorhynchites rutilus septentrionalis]|uniref:DDB1- and CUL4-associated factor 8 isoform X2 n=1 Tax=Toxorhynchites rutilus septentrionalis TaxID=329112 RepID=UPI00247B1A1A|nr:DDB1- and CUL4-associated factor 8 isoform X2 [Toxorhynchites rutilus septentrionalis]
MFDHGRRQLISRNKKYNSFQNIELSAHHCSLITLAFQEDILDRFKESESTAENPSEVSPLPTSTMSTDEDDNVIEDAPNVVPATTSIEQRNSPTFVSNAGEESEQVHIDDDDDDDDIAREVSTDRNVSVPLSAAENTASGERDENVDRGNAQTPSVDVESGEVSGEVRPSRFDQEERLRRLIESMIAGSSSELDSDDDSDYDGDNDDNNDASSTAYDSPTDDSDSRSSRAGWLNFRRNQNSTERPTRINEEDIGNLRFMQSANVTSNWNCARAIQLRSLGLSYQSKGPFDATRYNSNQFQSRAYASKRTVQMLTLLCRLRKHSGCVNSLNFNASGTLLASGSDDLNINIWNWRLSKLVRSIRSVHHSNVFQTKFVETSGYRDEIEIISTARDGQVLHTRIGPAGDDTQTVLFNQKQAIHKVAIPAQSPFEFLTACENGSINSYDLREKKVRKVAYVKTRLYSISAHPLDNEFCVSGGDAAVRVYDRRRSSKPMKYHFAAHLQHRSNNFAVTCAVYNHNGNEVLASYSDGDVFLFNNVSCQPGSFLHRYTGHMNLKTIKGVNFFGLQSEYVVSGSDCGNIFFWDKNSEVIVNWIKGDRAGVVNCLEPHPEYPILATSGLDHDIKIWVPNGVDDEHEMPNYSQESLETCVRANLHFRSINEYLPSNSERLLEILRFSPRVDYRYSDAGGPDSDSDSRSGEDNNFDQMVLPCNPS